MASESPNTSVDNIVSPEDVHVFIYESLCVFVCVVQLHIH